MADLANAQVMLESLVSMDLEACAGVMVTLLQHRPELAPVMVNVCLPNLTYAPSTILTTKRAKGTIKSFNETTGYGFIACPELFELFGRDVFVGSKQSKGLTVGSAVDFAVVLNKDNHPQAFDINDPSEAAWGKGSGKGGDSWGKGAGKAQGKATEEQAWAASYLAEMFGGIGMDTSKGWGKGKGKSKAVNPADVMEELGEGFGTIKSFSMNNGYGFIDCPEMKEMGFQDVFVHHAQMGDFKVGDSVIFTCFLNSKAKAQGKDLRDGSAQAAAHAAANPGASTSRPTASCPEEMIQDHLGTLEGQIKSFNDKSGYGFINCPEVVELGYKDVFLHYNQLGEFRVGDTVKFTAFINKKQNVQAMELERSGKKRKIEDGGM